MRFCTTLPETISETKKAIYSYTRNRNIELLSTSCIINVLKEVIYSLLAGLQTSSFVFLK